MRFLVLLIVMLGAGAAALYLKYGTVEPCSILRERIRRQEMAGGGQITRFVVSEVPDRVLDSLLAAQYGPLSPGRCVGLLVHGLPGHLSQP